LATLSFQERNENTRLRERRITLQQREKDIFEAATNLECHSISFVLPKDVVADLRGRGDRPPRVWPVAGRDVQSGKVSRAKRRHRELKRLQHQQEARNGHRRSGKKGNGDGDGKGERETFGDF
jgi:hypothetical protein